MQYDVHTQKWHNNRMVMMDDFDASLATSCNDVAVMLQVIEVGMNDCCLLWPQVHASLIVVLTRGGSTARLVAKYRPSIPVLTVAVPVLTTDSLTWTCSGEAPARQTLITRGLLPLLAEGSARATDSDTTDEILQVGSCCC